jgi:hypothetical protein
MKSRHIVLVALLVLAVNACSDDDEGGADPCEAACSKLSYCGMGVNCGGVELEGSPCISACQQRQAHGAARCVIDVPRCSETEALATCAAQMPCP